MTVKDIKDITIQALKDDWIITNDNAYYIKELKEASKDDLQDILSDIENNTKSGLEYIHDMQDELSNIL